MARYATFKYSQEKYGISATPTYGVLVDWNGDGEFDISTSGGENLHDDIVSIIIDRGFSDLIGRTAKVGRCTIVLNNSDKNYSPPLDPNLLPRRNVQVWMSWDGETVSLFRGFIESIQPDPNIRGKRQATLECVDAIALLQLHETYIPLMESQRGDQIIQTVVADCYTPPGTNYDTDINTFPFAGDKWSDDLLYGKRKQRALKSIRDVCRSNWGWFFIGKDGSPTFHNRHHRLVDVTIKATLSNAMSKMKYIKSVESVFNHVEVIAHPRSIGDSNEVLWELEASDPPKVEPGQFKIFRAKFRDPNQKDFNIGGKSVIPPVSGTDYTVNASADGSGQNLTTYFSVSANIFANMADITITNNGSIGGYITLIRIRGLAVRVYSPPIMFSDDSLSQADYQKRSLLVDATLQDSIQEAQEQADYLLGRYKDPLDEISGCLFHAGRSATLLNYARDIEIGDRIGITESQTGLSDFECFVSSIHHQIDGASHKVQINIEKADAGNYWIMNISQLGTDTRLAY